MVLTRRHAAPRVTGVLLVACAIAAAEAAAAGVTTIEGRGAWAYDGDTVALVDRRGGRHRVRLAAVDAPEQGRPYAARSRRNLDALVRGVPVRAHCHTVDRYGRPVCRLMVAPPDCRTCPPTLDAGLAQIEAGYARWYRHYAREQAPEARARYAGAEAAAREARRGLWRNRRKP